MRAEQLQIAGLVPLSSVDWPGQLTLTVFCQGCPWQCNYCQNCAIIDPHAPGKVRFTEVVDLLETRRGLLDAVVFSGGEACLQPALASAAEFVKSAGYQVGLHTCGAFPNRLADLLQSGVIDWVGLDIKAAPTAYDDLVGRSNTWGKVRRSLITLWNSGVQHELRTTLTPQLASGLDDLILALAAARTTHLERAGKLSSETLELIVQAGRLTGTTELFQRGWQQALAGHDWQKLFTEVCERAANLGEEKGVRVTTRSEFPALASATAHH